MSQSALSQRKDGPTPDDRPRPDAGRGSPAAEALHSGLLADVLDGFGVWGVIDPSIVRLSAARHNVLARAHTVRWKPVRKARDILAPSEPTWNRVKDFLLPAVKDGAGIVYTAGVEDGLLRPYALAGGFSAGDLRKRGFEALLLGGAIRDAHVVGPLDLPVWATNFTPADTQGNYEVAETGTWCRIGAVTIRTGDWIFGDESGLVVVPETIAGAVFAEALRLLETEREIARRTESGADVFDVVRDVGHL